MGNNPTKSMEMRELRGMCAYKGTWKVCTNINMGMLLEEEKYHFLTRRARGGVGIQVSLT
jgi:hypothetical protein